jgi:plastocyanin
MRRDRARRLAVAVVACCMWLTACSSGGGSHSGTGKPVTVAITERNGTISPSGETVQVSRGAPVTFVVSSDVADEIHVHSEPDHEFEVKAGSDQRFRFAIDTPGSYEVESHGLNVVILKLQVS